MLVEGRGGDVARRGSLGGSDIRKGNKLYNKRGDYTLYIVILLFIFIIIVISIESRTFIGFFVQV